MLACDGYQNRRDGYGQMLPALNNNNIVDLLLPCDSVEVFLCKILEEYTLNKILTNDVGALKKSTTVSVIINMEASNYHNI